MNTADVISFSFCQVSDLNLDSSTSLELHLSPSQRKQRSEESLEALSKAMKAASSNSVDAVLVPGNLFDSENITTTTLAAVQKIFAMLGEIPVFIAPGANDPNFTDSPYDKAALQAHGLEPWSDNVHIFSGKKAQSFTLKDKGAIKITGIGFDKATQMQIPEIPELGESERVAINVLLMPIQVSVLNQSSEHELLRSIENKGYSFTALSGLKNHIRLKSANSIIGAASGTFVGQTEEETGPRFAIFGNLDRRLSGGLELTLQLQEFDPRRVISLRFDITGNNPSSLKTRLETQLKKSACRKGNDIVVLHLHGFYPATDGPATPILEELKTAYFHLKINDRSRPDYLQKLSDKNIIEAKLAGILDELKKQVFAESDKHQDEELLIIEDALYYGLEAIREGKVSIRHAD